MPKAHGGWALGRGTWQLLVTNVGLGGRPSVPGVRRFLLPRNNKATAVPIREIAKADLHRRADKAEFAGILAEIHGIGRLESQCARPGKLCRWVGFYNRNCKNATENIDFVSS